MQRVRQGDPIEGGKEASLLQGLQMRNLKFTEVQSYTWIFHLANSGVEDGTDFFASDLPNLAPLSFLPKR